MSTGESVARVTRHTSDPAPEDIEWRVEVGVDGPDVEWVDRNEVTSAAQVNRVARVA
jgi:hypothetical protein